MQRALGLAVAVLMLAGTAQAGPIHDAAVSGDVDGLVRLIKAGTNVNELNAAGETALMVAARESQRYTLQALLTYLADVNAKSPDGMTALHWAAYGNEAWFIETLDVAGADMDARNSEGETPLIFAAAAGKAATAVRLPNRRADLEAVDNIGRSALTRAGINGHEKVVTLLLRLGAMCQTIDAAWHDTCEARRAELGIK